MRVHTPLRGRDALSSTIVDLLSRKDLRLITMTGLAGVGKTRLLEHIVGDGLGTNGSAEKVWVDAVAAGSHGLLAEIVGAAGLPVTTLEPTVVGAALDAVAALVVIDGAHASPEAGDVIEQLIESTTSTRFVVTQRSPLRVVGEQIVRVEPFRSPPVEVSVSSLDSHPGVQIFLDVAAAAGTDLSDDPSALAAIAAIGERLGGLPGAIRLAASRVAAFSPSTMLTLLDEGTARTMLSGSTGGSELFAAISWTESLLEPVQQQLIRDLTVFSGPVPIDAIVAVSGLDLADALDHVGELVDSHLLGADHSGTMSTFALHPIVREHAEQNGRGVRSDTAVEARMRWVMDVAADADRVGFTDPLVGVVERDLIAVLREALDDGEVEVAATLAAALAPLWLHREGRTADTALLWTVAAALDDCSPDPGLRALITAWAALFRAEQAVGPDELVDVRCDRDESLALAALGDDRTRLAVLIIGARMSRILDDRDVARRLCVEALDLATSLRDEHNQARLETWLGMLAHQSRRIDEAIELGQASLERSRRLGDPSLIVGAAGFLLTLPPDAPVTAALPTSMQLVELAEQVDDHRALLWLRPAAIEEALGSGATTTAARLIADHLTATRRTGAWNWGAMSLVYLVQLAAADAAFDVAARLHGVTSSRVEVLRSGLPPRAVADYDRAVDSLRRSLGDDRFDSLVGAGALLSMQDAQSEAIDYARAVAERSGIPRAGTSSIDSVLTDREIEVLDRLVAGDRNKDIALRLGITPKTVMHHTSSIYRKLGVRGRSEAVARALRSPGTPAA